MSQPTCPSCRQLNEEDMAFCIFCGSTLKPGSMSGRKPTVSGELCQSCGKSDPLNSKYCVLCGAEIKKAAPHAEAAADHKVGAASSSPSEVALQGGAEPRVRPTAPKRGGGNPQLIIGATVALGLGVGGASALLIKQSQPNEPVAPKQGLSILTDKPFTDVLLSLGPKQDTFVMGLTGKDGNFYLPDPRPGSYSAQLGGTPLAEPFKVTDGKAVVDAK